MTSSRAVVLELESSETKIVPLGSTLQERGVIDKSGVLFPGAIALFVESVATDTRPNGGSDSTIFYPARASAASIVAGDVIYGTTNTPLVVLPSLGQPSYYRFRATVGYNYVEASINPSPINGPISLQATFVDSNGVTSTRRVTDSDIPFRLTSLTLEFVAQIASITSFTLFNDNTTTNTLTYGGQSGNTRITTLTVEYLGAA